MIALATAVTLPATAMADTKLKDRGLFGQHSLRDSWQHAGVICHYKDDWSAIQSMDVRAPRVWARDTTPGVDQQQVGWIFLIKGHANGQTTTLYKSPMQVASATDTQMAPFATVSVSTSPPGGHHYVVIKMFWFEPGSGVVEGWAKHRVDRYHRQTSIDSGADEAYCAAGLT
jgi:hypothetical protein